MSHIKVLKLIISVVNYIDFRSISSLYSYNNLFLGVFFQDLSAKGVAKAGRRKRYLFSETMDNLIWLSI